MRVSEAKPISKHSRSTVQRLANLLRTRRLRVLTEESCKGVIIRRGSQWQSKLPLIAGQHGSWLAFQDGKAGCLACKRGACGGPLAKFVFRPDSNSFRDLQKHARTKKHQAAVASFLGLPDTSLVNGNAPTKQQFAEVRNFGASQPSNKHGLTGIGKRKQSGNAVLFGRGKKDFPSEVSPHSEECHALLGRASPPFAGQVQGVQ